MLLTSAGELSDFLENPLGFTTWSAAVAANRFQAQKLIGGDLQNLRQLDEGVRTQRFRFALPSGHDLLGYAHMIGEFHLRNARSYAGLRNAFADLRSRTFGRSSSCMHIDIIHALYGLPTFSNK